MSSGMSGYVTWGDVLDLVIHIFITTYNVHQGFGHTVKLDYNEQLGTG